jgi:hypothetical protein
VSHLDQAPPTHHLVELEQSAIPEGPFPHSPRLEPYMIVSKSYGSTPVVQLSFLTVVLQAVKLAFLVLLRPCTKFPLQVPASHGTSPLFTFR